MNLASEKPIRHALFPLLLAICCAGAAMPQALTKSGGLVAYSVAGVLTIRSASGRTLRTFRTTPPIGTFAISPDARSIVFAPPGPAPMHNGGQLYLLSIATGKIRRLTHAPAYEKWDAYAYPDYSPRGDEVVFAIHSQLGPVPVDGDDLATDAGPFAMLDIRTGAVKILSSTLNIGGQGTAYGSSARWSPNGTRIFLNLEDDFVLVDPAGNQLQDTSKWTHSGTLAVGWLGDECVVYIGGSNWKTGQPARVLNLISHKTGSLDKLLGVPSKQVTNLVDFSPAIQVRQAPGGLIVHSASGTWSVTDPERYPDDRVLSTKNVQIPTSCR